MASSFLDVCRFNPTAGGTTDWTYSSAVTGYQSPSAAGVVNGATYSYRAESADLTQWEIGTGSYNTGTGVLARTTVLFNSSGTTSKINFSAAPQVAIVALAEDLRAVPPPQGRLTLVSATPVMSSSQTAKTTIYYTPYVGNSIPLYDGANMVATPFSEISVATTDTTKNPAAIGASKVNDWFVWNDSGTLRLSHGPDWTNDSTRSAGTALTMVNGILLNSIAITNGPAASRGTYVGTTRSDGSSQLNWQFGGAATAALLYVWNTYNRVSVSGAAWELTSTWTYTSATVRTPNGATNSRVSFVCGLAEDSIDVTYIEACNLPAVVGAFNSIGFNLDSTTVMDKTEQPLNNAANVLTTNVTAVGTYAPQLGAHFVQALEAGDGTNTSTFIGNTKMTLRVTTRM